MEKQCRQVMARVIHHLYSDSAEAFIDDFHAQSVAEVRSAIAAHTVVVVGMAHNPYVRKARKALTGAGISFHYIEYGNYLSQWRKRLAVKLWSGWPTYPQVFLRGRLLGGFQRVQAALADGSFQRSVSEG